MPSLDDKYASRRLSRQLFQRLRRRSMTQQNVWTGCRCSRPQLIMSAASSLTVLGRRASQIQIALLPFAVCRLRNHCTTAQDDTQNGADHRSLPIKYCTNTGSHGRYDFLSSAATGCSKCIASEGELRGINNQHIDGRAVW